MSEIPLTKLQSEIMKEFYTIKKQEVIYDKRTRNNLWKKAIARRNLMDLLQIEKKCPALANQIAKSYETGKNIQPAVFSECVYAQTLANMFELNQFHNCLNNNNDMINKNIKALLKSYSLVPRYVYYNSDKSRMLIQAGGCNGIDSALITVMDLNIYTIEFKEQGAKASEPDLPKYGEDGKIKITDNFIERYPQFKDMLLEQKNLNFFESMGHNINKFSDESVNLAVTNNYRKKYADVLCTEDCYGNLVMMPVNQISIWANLEGEIRPAGRNHYKVWTPKALKRFLENMGASIEENTVCIKKEKLQSRKERGGNGRISGYKINPLFFVYIRDCYEKDGLISFNIDSVRQLKPTITGKMFFEKLSYDNVKKYYGF